MPPARYRLELHEQDIRVTADDIRKVEQLFSRGYSNNSAYEELVLDVVRKLRKLVGKIKQDKHESVAVLVKILTENRTVDEASRYLKSEEGESWLSQWTVPKASAIASGTATTASRREQHTSAPGGRFPVLPADGHVMRHVNLPDEVLAGSLQGSSRAAERFENVDLVLPAMTQAMLPESAHRGAAHSPTRSDVSIDFSAQRCPRCQQFHPPWALISMLQFLEQHGYGTEELRPQRVATGQQSRHFPDGPAVFTQDIAPAGHIAAVAERSSASLRDPIRAQRLSLDIALKVVWLGVLGFSIYMVDILPRLGRS